MLASLSLLFLFSASMAQPARWTAADNKLPAFPGAEGFGRYTVGGRGGKVYHVTTLQDGEQEGTFRYAVNQKGVRTVVFDVAGTIFLESPLRIKEDSLTIAGQSAPGQGICIARYPITIRADHVIMRYLHLRVGNEVKGEPDGLGGTDQKNIIIDHCSISWSVDETCSIYGNENTTVQWCIISESLNYGGHQKGTHGYGGIVGGNHASFHHNLMVHHVSRVPRLGPRPGTQTREYVDVRNNVYYNWAGNGCYGAEGMKVNLVNNYYKPGPATPHNKVRYRIISAGVRSKRYCYDKKGQPNVWYPMLHVWGKYYVDGNVVEGCPEVTADNWEKGVYEQLDTASAEGCFSVVTRDTIRLHMPLETGVITTHTALEAYDKVLASAGCSKWRDKIDERIVSETRNGTAAYRGSIGKNADRLPGIIDTPKDVMLPGENSPWVKLLDGGVKPEERLDTDGDGMPDVWEKAHGLNPYDSADGVEATLSSEGYTNLEVYLNEGLNVCK